MYQMIWRKDSCFAQDLKLFMLRKNDQYLPKLYGDETIRSQLESMEVHKYKIM